ncbi:uncharacterized protein LOC123293425 isoform X2 [Chrysoperla carnea]|uniref:uncharacterized protein LOC123293425 isoform X2 n=1 Tax=Chrysoperla carnea TaxID=189513 RepID=UPI001D066A8C|nr:uncharacterized protein LOC123293425 isoform X2 [Chrysoperla carnea]
MSYNTRNNRGGNYQAASSPATRGNTNFVHGGQQQGTPNQKQQQQQQYQAQQQQQVTPQYQTTTTNVAQQQTPIKSIMKTKPEPVATPKVENNSNIDGNGVEGTNDGTKPKRPWNTGVNKLSKKERRSRRNKRIGKLVRPKNAIMVLNELCGGASLKFDDIGTQNGLFGVAVSIDNTRYEAFASSKNGAKQKACENALKGYIASKIKAKQQGNTSAESMETEDSKPEDEDAGDDVSWCHLASFALYKLMDSWQDVSEIMQPDAIFQKIHQKPSSTPKPIKELPANAADIHPVMLLHQMRPGIVIEDVSSSGQTPHIIYTVKVNIDGDQIFGQGPNKKSARKNCAQAAMEKHFGVVYPPPPAPVAPAATAQQPSAFPVA